MHSPTASGERAETKVSHRGGRDMKRKLPYLLQNASSGHNSNLSQEAETAATARQENVFCYNPYDCRLYGFRMDDNCLVSD